MKIKKVPQIKVTSKVRIHSNFGGAIQIPGTIDILGFRFSQMVKLAFSYMFVFDNASWSSGSGLVIPSLSKTLRHV